MLEAIEEVVAAPAVPCSADRSTEGIKDREDAAHENTLHAWQPPESCSEWFPKNTTAPAVAGAVVNVAELVQCEITSPPTA